MYGNEDGSIPATFEILYMIGWKPHDSQVWYHMLQIFPCHWINRISWRFIFVLNVFLFWFCMAGQTTKKRLCKRVFCGPFEDWPASYQRQIIEKDQWRVKYVSCCTWTLWLKTEWKRKDARQSQTAKTTQTKVSSCAIKRFQYLSQAHLLTIRSFSESWDVYLFCLW